MSCPKCSGWLQEAVDGVYCLNCGMRPLTEMPVPLRETVPIWCVRCPQRKRRKAVDDTRLCAQHLADNRRAALASYYKRKA